MPEPIQPELFPGDTATTGWVQDTAARDIPGHQSIVRLIQADFLGSAAREVEDGSIDVVMTSPPYNIGVKYSNYRDDLATAAYLEWCESWALEVRRCLVGKGSFFLNIGSRPKQPWVPWDVVRVFQRHFRLQNVIHWIKSISIDKRDVGNHAGIDRDVTVGHYKPINSDRYLNDQHEYIFHLTHAGDVSLDRLAIGVPYQDPSNIGRWKSASGGLHCRGNTWFTPYPTIKYRAKDRPHPATFPPMLPERCFRLHGLQSIHRVMDPFIGLGTTAVAAAGLGIDCIGFDIDGAYLDVARQSLSGLPCQVRLDRNTDQAG